MDLARKALDLFLHLDRHLNTAAGDLGAWLYGLIFLIVFVAGIGQMSYSRFAVYNVTGGIVWVNSFLLAGYFFADLPVVRERSHYIILAISVISAMPIGIEYLRARREARRSGPARARDGPSTDSARPRRSPS
jgi:membrane protein DedA with SNARE-associated domain